MSRLNSDLMPDTIPEGPDWAAGLVADGGSAPSFGSGAGVGRGMVSETAADDNTAAPSSTAPTNTPWRLPAIVPSPYPASGGYR